MLELPPDLHGDCQILCADDRGASGDFPSRGYDHPFCAVHHNAIELVEMARHLEEEAERCAKRGYAFHAFGALLDARTAWGAAVVHLLVWLCDECPAHEQWAREQPIDVEPTDDELDQVEAM